MERRGNDRVWATLYRGGWWLYHREDGIIAENLTETQARSELERRGAPWEVRDETGGSRTG